MVKKTSKRVLRLRREGIKSIEQSSQRGKKRLLTTDVGIKISPRCKEDYVYTTAKRKLGSRKYVCQRMLTDRLVHKSRGISQQKAFIFSVN